MSENLRGAVAKKKAWAIIHPRLGGPLAGFHDHRECHSGGGGGERRESPLGCTKRVIFRRVLGRRLQGFSVRTRFIEGEGAPEQGP